MDQRRAPRTSWSLKETKYGKPYIDHGNDQKTIGYNITHSHNIVGMACAIGPKHKVWNIDCSILLATYLTDNNVPQLTPLELSFLDPTLPDEVKLRRLYILWTLKESYTKALGQPIGFDFSRIECDIPHRQIRVDGEPLLGWEFRLFRANTGVLRKGTLVEESYQCTTAIYRGGNTTKLLWEHEDGVGEGDKWLRFARQNQNALLTELLGFVPQLLLDDIADAATDTVNNAIDGLEDELDAEIDSGLLEFQTLLCGHRDMSIDMLETWSMRNVFCVPEGLNIVMPHQKGLDLSTPQGKDVQMQVELDVMRRKIENARRFQEQLKQAEQVTEHRLERSKARLDRVKTLQELDPKKIEHLPAAYRSLLTTISSLPTTTPPLPMSISSTKKHTESRAEFIDWAVKRLVTSTTAGPSGKLDLLAQNVRQDEEGDDEFMLAGVAGERGPGESLASHEASLVDSEESSVLNTSKRRRSSVAGGSKRRRSSMGLSERARAIGGELSTETRQDEAE
ncbi:kinetochore protein Mis12/MTW1 [Rhizoctonia solani]|uniref:Kinetochore protein Mis12/MTW1 n=1 Tax=Rhizoctonia solani TaxID=456999 RepID=A0A8H8P8C5_9AGAM|nr:kinetochore protein Mis12/MTW1 [Rhizoctonia solani]QRW26445.1 kinetochore protein Mis12/MTW1 [Rhizoctonia solani]